MEHLIVGAAGFLMYKLALLGCASDSSLAVILSRFPPLHTAVHLD